VIKISDLVLTFAKYRLVSLGFESGYLKEMKTPKFTAVKEDSTAYPFCV